LLPGLGRAVAFALPAGGVEQLFRERLVLGGESEVCQLQFIGAQHVAVEDVEDLTRHVMGAGDLGKLGLDLLQMALAIPEKSGYGFQGGQPRLGMRRQPRCRRVGRLIGRRIVVTGYHVLFGDVTFRRCLFFIGKNVLECFRQIRLEFLKFLIDVLGPLDQRLEIHHDTSLTLDDTPLRSPPGVRT